ncbi:MAG: dienelactone hydrolase family protein [Sphingomicrobium sp.]
MTDDIRRSAIALYDRFTHTGMDRRLFMRRMVALAGSAAAAEALIGTISASPAAAALTDPGDPRLIIKQGLLGFSSPLSGYVAVKKGTTHAGVVIVIHENRGLNAHIEDVARRFALAGYFTVAPDLLSSFGGTPADEDAARAAIGRLDLEIVVGQVAELARHAPELRHDNGRVGGVGFCWGGAFVDRLAVEAGPALNAAVAYYGPAPDPSEAVRVQTPLLLHYAGLDTRVDATGKPWVEALQAAHKDVTAFTYPGVDHAFNNDTSAERYNKPAADLAWTRTLAFFAKHLSA